MEYSIEDVFYDYFDEWQEEELYDVLDDRFDDWHIVRDYGGKLLHIYVLLNDVDLYGEELDSFLEYQVLGMIFLEDMGLLVERDYYMEDLLDVLSEYIMVYSIEY